ncbi:MAG: DUF4476 domain-containing protein [Proteobacteria bacterium]|nr:DUF4476 domain-containing protein [Pseudomonadota bacterium]
MTYDAGMESYLAPNLSIGTHALQVEVNRQIVHQGYVDIQPYKNQFCQAAFNGLQCQYRLALGTSSYAPTPGAAMPVRSPPAPMPTVVHTPPPLPDDMLTQGELDSLLGSINGTATYEEEIAIVQGIAQEWHVNIIQVSAIVKVMGTIDNEIQAVQILAPKVVDPENLRQLVIAMGTPEGAKKAIALFHQQ